jgi:hypothetical protein
MTTCSSNAEIAAARAVRGGPSPEQVFDGDNEVRTLFSARRFDFGGVESSGAVDLWVAEAIDVSAYSSARLNVRVHEADIAGSAKIEVVVYTAAPSPEDPKKTFLVASAVAVVELSELLVTGGAGILRGATIYTLGSFVAVAVRGTQGGTVSDCNAILSAELVLRPLAPRDDRGGKRILALPRTELYYTALAPSTTDSVVLVRALDVRDYLFGYLALRVHERSIGANAQFSVEIHGALPDGADPDTDFLTTTPDVTFTILPGTTPELHPVELIIAPFLFVRVVATQSATGGDLTAAISLDFVGKE